MPRTKGATNRSPRRVLVAARLPEEIAAYLRPNVTEKLEQIVREKMDERTKKEQQARARIDGMGFTQDVIDIIFYDWPNWDEHLDWLLTETRENILGWATAPAPEE